MDRNNKARRRFRGRGPYGFRDDVDVLLICPTSQGRQESEAVDGVLVRRPTMYFVAAALLVLSGVFYAAGHHEMGSYGADVCRYGGTFCDNPHWVLTGAGLAAVWAKFVSIR
jgi:hypothetical protein